MSFKMPEIHVDTTFANKIGSKCNEVNKNGENTVLRGQLAAYKTKTVGGRKLSDEDISKATEVARKLHIRGILTPNDREWCNRNGIKI